MGLGILALAIVFPASVSAQTGVRAKSASPGPSWGYIDSVGPSHWGELPGADACSMGQHETPIPLVSALAEPQNGPAPSFYYRTSRVKMRHTGHTVEFAYDTGSEVRVGTKHYMLKSFHFHTPSEHVVDGMRHPMELHIVHESPDGEHLVVGVFMKVGMTNAALFQAFQNLPWTVNDEHAPRGALINVSNLLPRKTSYFQYRGSLTTPPCTEGVEWYVMRHPVELADAQIAAFQRLPYINPNNRPLQPINGRVIYLRDP